MSGIGREWFDADADEPHTIGRWLDDRADASPDAIAIDDRGVRIGYLDLRERAHDLALSLRRAGYGPGDRIATVSGNSIDHVVAFFACAKTGIAFVPLSWRLTPGELAGIIDRTASHLLLFEDEYAALAMDALGRCVVGVPTAVLGTTGVEAHVPARAERFASAPVRAVRDDDVLLVIFTSGSEAAPKGVMLTHANCFWNNLALAGVAQLTRDDVVLAMLPQFHVAAWNVQPLLAWWVGATVVLERSFQPGRVLPLIQERGITVMMGVPTQYQQLADDARFSDGEVSSLRLAQVGGATMPEDLRAAWAARGVDLLQGYGLTEAGPNVLSVRASEAATSAGAVGRPYPHVDVRLADPVSGMPLEDEATGELWVRGPSVSAGYLDDVEATRRARDGAWLRSGDLAHRNADGVYRIVDRIKDMYVSGGENVAPAEVEAALCRHPLVAAAAVVAVPDRVWGERGVAFVARRTGAALSQDELFAHARSQLAGFKVPIRIVVVDDLPHSAIDKLARSQLRDAARELVEEGDHEPAR